MQTSEDNRDIFVCRYVPVIWWSYNIDCDKKVHTQYNFLRKYKQHIS